MNVLIILGHPDKKSFNHAIAQTCKTELENNGHSVFFHDLYEEKFNPVHQIDDTKAGFEIVEIVKNHCDDLINSDGIIVIHPNWWGQAPAIVKGWIDRVLLQGIAYDFVQNDSGEYDLAGLLKAKTALIFNTSNTAEYAETKHITEPLEMIWKNQVFMVCGIDHIERKNFGSMKESGKEQRLQWLSEIQSTIDSYFPKEK